MLQSRYEREEVQRKVSAGDNKRWNFRNLVLFLKAAHDASPGQM